MIMGHGQNIKKYLIIIFLSISILFTGCAFDNDPVEETQENTESEVSPEEDNRKSYEVDIYNPDKPEVIKVILSGECKGKIGKKVSIFDLYGMNVMHSGVVGLVGVPVDVSFSDVDDVELTFVYDEDELRGIPESNLIMLRYDEKSMFYKTVNKCVCDTEANTITAPIKKEGVYLLVDAYQWYTVWGIDASEYEYDMDMTLFVSDWERQYNTGSIMELADKNWAYDNAPNFCVSTPEELASVVYYVNSRPDEWEEVSVTLISDIDLTGYTWMPMGWYKNGNSHAFCGTIDGQGHTIKGMSIRLGYDECGFIGRGLDVIVRNINFEDAYVSGTSGTGIVGGEILWTNVWENVHATGVVEGGDDDYGGIIGREGSITFRNCSAAFLFNGVEEDFLSYRQKMLDEIEVVETFTLTLYEECDYLIVRDEHDGFESLGWHIELDGVQVLDRNAENETMLDSEYQWLHGKEGVHTIYLTAWIDGMYVRVSNIIEYEL